jgi:hypothetical protein
MAIVIEVPASVTTAATLVCTVPPGAATVVISNSSGSANQASIGTTSAVTTANGFPLPVGALITLPGHVGSAGTAIYAISAGTATVGAIISTVN